MFTQEVGRGTRPNKRFVVEVKIMPEDEWKPTGNTPTPYYDTREEAEKFADEQRVLAGQLNMPYRVVDTRPELGRTATGVNHALQVAAYQKVFDTWEKDKAPTPYAEQYAEWIKGIEKMPPTMFGLPYGSATGRYLSYDWETGKSWEKDKNLARNAPIVDPDDAYLETRGVELTGIKIDEMTWDAPKLVTMDLAETKKRVLKENTVEEKEYVVQFEGADGWEPTRIHSAYYHDVVDATDRARKLNDDNNGFTYRVYNTVNDSVVPLEETKSPQEAIPMAIKEVEPKFSFIDPLEEKKVNPFYGKVYIDSDGDLSLALVDSAGIEKDILYISKKEGTVGRYYIGTEFADQYGFKLNSSKELATKAEAEKL